HRPETEIGGQAMGTLMFKPYKRFTKPDVFDTDNKRFLIPLLGELIETDHSVTNLPPLGEAFRPGMPVIYFNGTFPEEDKTAVQAALRAVGNTPGVFLAGGFLEAKPPLVSGGMALQPYLANMVLGGDLKAALAAMRGVKEFDGLFARRPLQIFAEEIAKL